MGLAKVASTVSSIGSKLNTAMKVGSSVNSAIGSIQGKMDGSIGSAGGMVSSLANGVSLKGGIPSIPDIGSIIPKGADIESVFNQVKSGNLSSLTDVLNMDQMMPNMSELTSGLGQEMNIPTDITQALSQSGIDANQFNLDDIFGNMESQMPDTNIENMLGQIQMPNLSDLF